MTFLPIGESEDICCDRMDDRNLDQSRYKIQASDPGVWYEDFPLKEFAKLVSEVWFKKVVPSVVNSIGTSDFRAHWNNAIYDHYKREGGHEGILIIGATTYKYIVNGAQLLNTHQTSPGSIYYPASKQTRELAPQISIG